MQTILALLALSVAMLFTLTMQANIVSQHSRSILTEYEVMAGAVAVGELERLELETYSNLFSYITTSPDTVLFEIENLAIPFLVDVDVSYVDEAGAPSASTDYTLVELTVTNETVDNLYLRQERIYTLN